MKDHGQKDYDSEYGYGLVQSYNSLKSAGRGVPLVLPIISGGDAFTVEVGDCDNYASI